MVTGGPHRRRGTVREAAVEIARSHTAKAGSTLATIKARLYAPALAALRAKDIQVL